MPEIDLINWQKIEFKMTIFDDIVLFWNLWILS